DDAERPLSGIDQDIAALNVRRSQVMIELDQRRATLARLEIQLRNQEQTIEQLRMDREAGAAQAAESGDEDPALAPAREARAAAAVRRADALLIDARLDARSLPVRTELLRLEAQADELELVWIA